MPSHTPRVRIALMLALALLVGPRIVDPLVKGPESIPAVFAAILALGLFGLGTLVYAVWTAGRMPGPVRHGRSVQALRWVGLAASGLVGAGHALYALVGAMMIANGPSIP